MFLISFLSGALPCVGGAQLASSPSGLFQQAVNAQQQGDDALAIRDYKELLRTHPEAVELRVNLGATLAHSKRYGEAIEQYRLVLAKAPHNQLARMNLALAYQAIGKLAPAISTLEQLQKDNPEYGPAILLLADCYLQSGRGQDAVALLGPFEPSHPDDSDLAWLLGSALAETGHAQEGAERLEKSGLRSGNADAWLRAGQVRLRLSQFDFARKDADAAKAAEPNLPGLSTLIGMIQEQTADYDGAEISLLQAVAADEKDFDAHYYLGAIYYFKRDMEKARVQLARALTLQPASAQARFEMALVERTDGHLDAELRDLERVVQQSPDWLQPHVELSALYFRLHRPEDGAKQKEIVDRLMAQQQQSESKTAPH